MNTFYDKYKGGMYSQNGEASIIDECVNRIGIFGDGGNCNYAGIAVEFGAPTKQYCSNIFHLKEQGFTLWYFDPQPQEPGIMPTYITPENVNTYIPQNCKVLSIDIDGNDYNVWKAYTGKPEIVVIEINSSFPPTVDTPISDPQHGTAYKPMVQLGIEKGYFLLCHTGNLVFVRNEFRKLFPEIEGDGLSNHELYFNKSWLQC